MPVTDLAFAGRWPEDRRKEIERTPGQHERKDSTGPPVVREFERSAMEAETAAAVEPLKRAVRTLSNHVDIQYRRDLEMVVMVVYKKDPETGLEGEEVVRQIPPEDAVRLAQQLEKGKATILDEIA